MGGRRGNQGCYRPGPTHHDGVTLLDISGGVGESGDLLAVVLCRGDFGTG